MNAHIRNLFRSSFLIALVMGVFMLTTGAACSGQWCLALVDKCARVEYGDPETMINPLSEEQVAELKELIQKIGDESLARDRDLMLISLKIQEQLEKHDGATAAGLQLLLDKIAEHDANLAKQLQEWFDKHKIILQPPTYNGQPAQPTPQGGSNSMPDGYTLQCKTSSDGWHPSEGAMILCWDHKLVAWTQDYGTVQQSTPISGGWEIVWRSTTRESVPGISEPVYRFKIKERATGVEYDACCVAPGTPTPRVGAIGVRFTNGDWAFPGPNGWQRLRPCQPGGGILPTWTPQSGGNNGNVSVAVNNDGTVTITVNGNEITINQDIWIELQNNNINEQILELLLAQQQWQQQIIDLLLNQNWPAQDIVIMVIVLVTGEQPAPGQSCIQLRVYSCDMGRWFATPCDAADAGARVLVTDPGLCPGQVPTSPPGATATATATQGGGGNPTATATRQGGGNPTLPPNPTATQGGSNQPTATPTATDWWATGVPPTATRGPVSTEPPVNPTATPEPTSESTPGTTPDPDPTKEPIKACTLTDQQVMDMHGFSPRQVKLVFTGENIEWDPCKWTLQAVGIGHVPLPLLPGFRYTVTEYPSERVSVWGPGGNLEVAGATIRYVSGGAYDTDPARWVLDNWTLWAGEFRFGANRTPAYRTENGNLSVNVARFPTRNPLWGPLEAAMLLGGLPSEWSLLPDPVKFKFKTGGRLVDLQYHGVGCYDHWRMGNCYRGAIKTDEATFNAVP